MATVTAAIGGLSVNHNSESSLFLLGTGFVKGSSGTMVTVHYPTTGSVLYEWTGKVHKTSTDSTKAEVKVKQNKMLTAEQLKKQQDVIDLVRILVDATKIDVPIELYQE
jgi:hypothetical protein